MKTVLELTAEEALKFFMTAENYSNLSLPAYLNFQPILDYAQKSIGKKDFNSCLQDSQKKPSLYEGVNYKILINKDGRYNFRPLQLANPFLYYLLVRTITESNNWTILKQRFEEFKDVHIEVPSIPALKNEKDKTLKGTIITNWWEKVEQRTIELSLQFKYMFITDITNCYSSIYTHAIGWAIEGKDQAKKNRGKNSSLGNTIDTYIQGMQYGQTNGIPQGSALFDFIAEIILGYIDMQLYNKLNHNQINEYKIIRYRDDYRIFSNNKEEIKKIALVLHNILADLNLQMNSSKTKLSEDIVIDAIKPDKLYYITNIPAYHGSKSLFPSFQKELYYILSIAKRYPNSGTVSKLLNNICARVEKKKIIEDVFVLVAILVEIAILSPKFHELILACISNFLDTIQEKEKKIALIKQVQEKFNTLPNIGHIQIWLQRITYKLDVEINADTYEEPLCKLVQGEEVFLWNLDWLKDSIKENINTSSICKRDKLERMTSIIKLEEIAIYDQYNSKFITKPTGI